MPGRKVIGLTPGPEYSKLSKMDIARMIAAAVKDVKNGGGRDIDLSI